MPNDIFPTLATYNIRKRLRVDLPEFVAEQMKEDGWKVYKTQGKYFVMLDREGYGGPDETLAAS